MTERFSRTKMLIGDVSLEKLCGSRVAVFGIGGVGGYVAEALARAGVGAIDLIDNDTVNATNLNRQIVALTSTLGKHKVEVMEARAKDINADIKINSFKTFFDENTINEFDFKKYDYVIEVNFYQ